MKPAPFEYHAPATLPEALDLLAELGVEAAPLAGGQSLTPLMNLRLARPANIVDLNRIGSLDFVRVDNGALRVGALVRHAEMERSEKVREALPVAPAVAPFIGYPAIRHRGTVVGSIAHADPAAEWPCVALAFDAEVALAKVGSTRTVPAESFFKTLLTTVREPDELVTEVAFSTRFDTWGFHEFARRFGDFAVIAAAVAVRTSDGVVAEARISLAGAGDRPLRVFEAEDTLVGKPLSLDAAAAAAAVAMDVVEPLEDIHGSAGYRRDLAGVAVERALNDAASRSR
jgi:carbon-monoxide dehydrogenase medium subunit